MDLKEYLVDTFHYNDWANKKLLEKIRQLPDKTEAVKIFSHLINAQNKWMARVFKDAGSTQMDWWKPLYDLDKLEAEWDKSVFQWLNYLNDCSEEELDIEVSFIGKHGGLFAVRPKDIATQQNYHSIHHRAQVQTIIRKQGLQPEFVDYISSKYRKLS